VAYGVVYDRQLPRERERGLVYVRLTADCALGVRGTCTHMRLACLQRRRRGAHAARRPPIRRLQLRRRRTAH